MRLFISFLLVVFCSACAKQVRTFSAQQAKQALDQKASEISSVRGRVWISSRSSEGKISFPALVLMDFKQKSRPLMRLEAIDLMGATHVLIILDAAQNLTWIDFDQKQIFKLKQYWHGVPLKELPMLFLGVTLLEGIRDAQLVQDSGLEVKGKNFKTRYLFDWIEPGPTLALNGIEGELDVGRLIKQKYSVQYSHYMDKKDFYLPQEVNVQGYTQDREHADLDLELKWRERTWNVESISQKAFVVPDQVF